MAARLEQLFTPKANKTLQGIASGTYSSVKKHFVNHVKKYVLAGALLVTGLAYREKIIGTFFNTERPDVSVEKDSFEWYVCGVDERGIAGEETLEGTITARKPGRKIVRVNLYNKWGHLLKAYETSSHEVKFNVVLHLEAEKGTDHFIDAEDENGNRSTKYLGIGNICRGCFYTKDEENKMSANVK